MSLETLPADEVHVWWGRLDVPTRSLDGLLSSDERARAARYRFETDRRRYTAARGLLRLVLSRYTGEAPEALAFRYGPFEKPYLAGPGPWFNLSHSGSVVIVGVRGVAEIGVDVEMVDPAFSAGRIPEHFFSPSEVRVLRELPAEEQERGFLRCWTRKEAFIKARGDGLQLALDSFDVTLAPGEPARLTRTAWSADEPARWQLADVSDPAGAFLAAVASPRPGWFARLREADALAA